MLGFDHPNTIQQYVSPLPRCCTTLLVLHCRSNLIVSLYAGLPRCVHVCRWGDVLGPKVFLQSSSADTDHPRGGPPLHRNNRCMWSYIHHKENESNLCSAIASNTFIFCLSLELSWVSAGWSPVRTIPKERPQTEHFLLWFHKCEHCSQVRPHLHFQFFFKQLFQHSQNFFFTYFCPAVSTCWLSGCAPRETTEMQWHMRKMHLQHLPRWSVGSTENPWVGWRSDTFITSQMFFYYTVWGGTLADTLQ